MALAVGMATIGGLLVGLTAPPAAAIGPPPAITGVSPATGPVEGGNTVTISGLNFKLPAGCATGTQVFFGAYPGNNQINNLGTNVQVLSNTKITVQAPASNDGQVKLVVSNSCGTSQPLNPVDGYTFTYQNDGLCPSATTCTVSVDGTQAEGPAQRLAGGLLHGFPTTTVSDACNHPTPFTPSATLQAELNQVNPSWWRVSSNDYHDYDLPHSMGAKIIEVVSDDWWCERGKVGDKNQKSPWNELDAFSSYVTGLVNAKKAANQPVDYWDIMNEPGGDPFIGGSVAQYLSVFKAGFQAIRAADPTAKVVSPSLGSFADNNRCTCLDLTTFLDYAQANNLSFDAVSWHEIDNTFPPAEHPTWSPKMVADHVASVRSLLAARPVVAGAKIFVDEYAFPDSHLIPGWQIGFIAAFEQANVDEANRSCWHGTQASDSYIECNLGFDGLVTSDGQTPQDLYWVYAFYGQMNGTRVATSSTANDLSAMATKDDASQTMKVLVGRHVNCGPKPYAYQGAPAPKPSDSCPQYSSPTASPINLQLSVRVPYALSTVHVHIERIPNTRGAMTSTTPVCDGVQTVTNGTVTLSVPLFADGDAYTVSLSPGSVPGVCS